MQNVRPLRLLCVFFAGLAAAICGACTRPAAPVAPAASKAPAAPCAPTLEAAWIRAAPPGTTMLAGYAQLHNACATTLTVVGAQSTDFASVSLHATLDRGGVSHMQEAGPLEVAPGASLELAPGGTHLMLMGPAQDMHEGATGRIDLVFADGRRASADFVVRRDAPVSP